MRTLEHSTAQKIFQLDESSRKVQVAVLAGEKSDCDRNRSYGM